MAILKKLLLKMILEDAIIREEAAYTFYESALEYVSASEAVALIKKLMAGELLHRMKLEGLQKKGALPPDALLEEIPITMPQDSSLQPIIGTESSLQDILRIALQKEQTAVSHYKHLFENTSVKIVREVFHLLSHEESQHVLWITQQLGIVP